MYSLEPLTQEIAYDDNEARFVFEPTLGTGLTSENISLMYNGKQTTFKVTINTTAPTPEPYRPSGGGSGGSSGSSSSIPPAGFKLNNNMSRVPITYATASGKFYNVLNDVYYSDASGNNVVGWLSTPDTKWYLFEYNEDNNKGKMITGFRQEANGWYFFNGDGKMATGLITINNNTYYFDDNKGNNEGVMASGWRKIGGDRYYFELNGVMLKGAVTPDNYKVDANGRYIP